MAAARADCEVVETEKPQLGHFLDGCRAAPGRPEAVMLDFVKPHPAGGKRVSFGREAGGDEAGRKRTQHGSKHRCAAAKCESSGGHSGRSARSLVSPRTRRAPVEGAWGSPWSP